ncbi:AAA family ATPase [Fervidobacterium islandicum]|uniref:AAA family ATPase n=1 Tax=Fervidobacterium islandicum TaxID=2423 RepID=UPI003A6B7290
MIELIHINEYVYLKDVDIYFSEGLNVITGETGTGKSLILDVIGSFLDYQNIRSETFSADMVLNLDMDFDEIGIRRGQHIFSVERKNKRLFYKVDGRLIGREQVQNILSNIITIHKQNSHMKLLDKDFILEVLDTVADNYELLEKYKELYENYQHVLKIIAGANKDSELKKLEELREKVNEIESAHLSEEEEQELEEKYKKALNLQTLLQNYSSVSQHLEEIENALRKIYSLIEDKYHEFLDTAVESIAELSNQISKELSKIEEMNLEEIENRLWVYKKLRRKYGPTTEDVIANLQKWLEEIKQIEKTIKILENAEEERLRLESELRSLAIQISEKRKNAARNIVKSIERHLKDLNMNARIDFYFNQKDMARDGIDDVELVGSTLSTGPLYPLRKIASGGELSRLMLALELSLASTDVLVYDEIDAGIGGVTAVKLADKLSELSKKHQVIVVTHLPQIALKADKHLSLRRTGDTGTVVELDERARDEEIKRMFGGEKFIELLGDFASKENKRKGK